VFEVWRRESAHRTLLTEPRERVSCGPSFGGASCVSKEGASVLNTVVAPNELRAKHGNNPAVHIQPVS
jgi:hypothetical protein